MYIIRLYSLYFAVNLQSPFVSFPSNSFNVTHIFVVFGHQLIARSISSPYVLVNLSMLHAVDIDWSGCRLTPIVLVVFRHEVQSS